MSVDLIDSALSHTPAGTAITTSGLLPNSTVTLSTSSLKVNFSQEKITVWPKCKGFVVVSIDNPENDKTIPVYSGWVTIAASTGEVLSVVGSGNRKSRFAGLNLCIFSRIWVY